ncbi:MAG TPA: Tat pathway signal sequence domain protein [Caulobacteraceae bacterium]|jgi:hypothetical protein|nr:Tat pathway signal sequence domain protein [Caulobacteraceae bacterium]
MSTLRSRLFAAGLALGLIGPVHAWAQMGGGGGGGRGGQQDQQAQDDAKRKQRELEFGGGKMALPKVQNAGPCPFVKVLYDAGRYVEFKGGAEQFSDVGYTGEIENIASACAYKSDQPITVRANILFELGRGPTAEGRGKTYRYWVAVTDRNHAVLDKTWFDMPVSFPAGVDRVSKVEQIGRIVIPRRDAKVSGANFEVLVGFDVTPQMADFNRAGKRFRPNAGQAAQVATTTR